METIYAKILSRRDSEKNWLAVDPILGEGEVGYSTDLKQVKIGDGKTRWSKLLPCSYTGLVDYIESIAQVSREAQASADAALEKSIEAQLYSHVAIETVKDLGGLADPESSEAVIAQKVLQIEENTARVQALEEMHIFLSEEEFENLEVKDPTKLYMIVE